MMDCYEKLLDHTDGMGRIIAGHDPLIAEQFVDAEPGLAAGIVAVHAVHAAPKGWLRRVFHGRNRQN